MKKCYLLLLSILMLLTACSGEKEVSAMDCIQTTMLCEDKLIDMTSKQEDGTDTDSDYKKMETEAKKLLSDSETSLKNVALPKEEKQQIPMIINSLKDYYNVVLNKHSKKDIRKKHFAFQDEAEKVFKKYIKGTESK